MDERKIRARLYGLLADACPEWIIEHKLEDAVSVSVASESSDFFSKIGVCYPELLRQFVERYLSEAGWDSETSSTLMRAIQNAARERPEEIEERLRRGAPALSVGILSGYHIRHALLHWSAPVFLCGLRPRVARRQLDLYPQVLR